MIEIINRLQPFFEDCYRRIHIREYAKLQKVSPPTAAKQLEEMKKEGLLQKEEQNGYYFYFANRENKLFVQLSQMYWYERLKESGLMDKIEKEYITAGTAVFGSAAKAEITPTSDIDIAIFSPTKKILSTQEFEKKLKHNIQIFTFQNEKDVKNENLLKNIKNGFLISGRW